jgi:hypothetical protein
MTLQLQPCETPVRSIPHIPPETYSTTALRRSHRPLEAKAYFRFSRQGARAARRQVKVLLAAEQRRPEPVYSRSSCDMRGRGWMLVMWAGASPTLTNLCALPGGAITI